MSDERDFEVVENRRVRAGDEPDSSAEAAGAEEADKSGELPPFTATGVLQTCVRLLSEGAWSWLGLMPDPITGKVSRDLAQARMGIDALRAIAGILEPVLEGSERRELQNVVANLQLNFVQQSAMSSKGSGE
jgi:hypothetical protein